MIPARHTRIVTANDNQPPVKQKLLIALSWVLLIGILGGGLYWLIWG